ncbi:MAG: hypothetical protein FJZ09_05135 [Candidatus Omnitrophica bacterium]|nr:hypothetical protein [Candidatus Omnitrophota bacterium]
MKIRSIFVLIALSLSAVTSAPAQEQSPPEISSPAQQKISLDIKGMDIVDVLKMLSMRAGMNIVVGKNVTGRVTIFLKDVGIWDAFEIILLANDLAYETKAGIVNVMTQRDYELIYGERFQDKKQAKIISLKYAKAADLSRALNQIKTNIGRIVADEASNTVVLIDSPQAVADMEEFIKKTDMPLETRVFSLNYAPADKLSPKLQESVSKGVGSVKVDERTNKIAITDYPDKLNELSKIISAFDEKGMQVLIDAQIVEIKPSDAFQMGVDWDYWLKKNVRLISSIPASSPNKISVGTAVFNALTDQTPKQEGKYKGILDLLRTIGDTKILSSPRIMALNNQEAKILVGTKEAYITSTTSQGASGQTVTSQSVNFVDVGIKLYVTPTINPQGFITMKIKPEISSSETKKILSEDQETEIPIVTTSEAETTVTIKDGVTIIIGGLRKDQRKKTVKKIPLLGDIPGIGFFFRNTSDELTKSELVILLTPHVMTGETSYTDFSEIRPKEGVVADMVKGKIVTERFSESRQAEALAFSRQETDIDYNKAILERINEIARTNPPEGNIKGIVSLYFRITADGNLKEDPQITGATDYTLVPFAVKAVKDASPFPAFPQGAEKKEEVFKMSLAYE